MALLWIEGFESFGQTNGNNPVGLQQKYDNANADTNFTIQAGRISGKAMRLPSTGSGKLGKVLTSSSTLIAGFGFYQDSFAISTQVFSWTVADRIQGSLEIQSSTGLWKYYRGTANLLGTSSGSAVTAGTWCYIELKVKFHASTGTVDLWVNGSSVLSLTGQNTSQDGNANATGFMLMGSGNAADHTQFDDLYILNDTGSNNTAKLGAQVVKILYPASDGGTNQWTPSSGTNHYDRVNESPHDVDTTYLEDSTSSDRELFGLDTLQIADVKGIQMTTMSRVTDNTIFSIKNSIHTSGGTDSDDTGITIASAVDYVGYSRVVETNPETSALWKVSAVNAAKFGFKTG